MMTPAPIGAWRGVITEQNLWVPRTVSSHATCRYSWMRVSSQRPDDGYGSWSGIGLGWALLE
jgi:hypothetical protein